VEGMEKLSVRQIQKICQKRLGLPSRSAAKKPLLTEKMVKKRLAFCHKHKSWSDADWENVMFSDESKFDLYNPRAQRCRRPSQVDRYKQKYVVTSVKHSPSVMIWGCFSGKGGRGSIFFLPAKTTMNSDAYISVLREKLFPFMTLHKVTKFLQDGAPCHTSKKSMAVLKEKEKEFTVMDWPGNSPDLNPIENLWAIMKGRLKKDHSITSLQKLEEAIKKMWVSDVPNSLCKRLARSMRKRIRRCIANGGQMTKY
jgi:DDE superfamily endonuclease